MNKIKNQLDLHLMIIPGCILTLIFCYIPILGNVIAFKDFTPFLGIKGSPWVGLNNFKYVFGLPNFTQVIRNTLFIATMKMIFTLIIPIIISLLMNEAANTWVKKGIQTALYLPYFMSWVILGGIFLEILSLNGPINNIISTIGINPIYFAGDNKWFPFTLVATDVWKGMGFSTIVYMAALTTIDANLYEASSIDGAGRWKQTLHITLPGMLAIIVLMGTLSLGNILNAGFEQVLVLYSPQVYQNGDILDTFIYRFGLKQAQYGPATAIGLFRSLVSCAMISLSYFLASKYANYRIF
jgi:putative aldouronate transport system permease protein